jgi:hypothetical protein
VYHTKWIERAGRKLEQRAPLLGIDDRKAGAANPVDDEPCRLCRIGLAKAFRPAVAIEEVREDVFGRKLKRLTSGLQVWAWTCRLPTSPRAAETSADPTCRRRRGTA